VGNLLPTDYSEFYSFKDGKWYNAEDFMIEYTGAFNKFMDWEFSAENVFIVVSSKLTSDKKYSLLGIEVQIIYDSVGNPEFLDMANLYLIEENDAAKRLLGDQDLQMFQYGDRLWIGKADKISEVKKRIIKIYEGSVKGIEF
jgi:hypothetical protein